MSLHSPPVEDLLQWFRAFEPSVLQNEDDVETKFVQPLFEHLGYASCYRRGKFPIRTYNPNRSGRKPEADNVYFSQEEAGKQDENTALVVIEAKEPTKQDLQEDIDQAKFYSNYLKPLLYVITNGIHILVYKRHRHRSDECIFDCSVDVFKHADRALELYRQLHFRVVKQLKEACIDDATNTLYTEIMQVLRQKPDVVSHIEKGDFQEYTDERDQKVIVSRPKVAIECELPLVLRGGRCRIEFSNVLLRGLTCQLTHGDIVHHLLLGLHTQPHWNTRCFLRQAPDGTFIAELGQTRVLLSEPEATDLCACVDVIGERYKQVISTTETLLESWEYRFKQTYEIPGHTPVVSGFSLLSVRPWLWRYMKEFARSFDYAHGNTPWHIFDVKFHSIRIHIRQESWTNVVLWAIAEETGDRANNDWLNILYYNPDSTFQFYEGGNEKTWKASIGPQGLWTVKYTQEWVVKQFIPKVLSYYKLAVTDIHSPWLQFQEWIAETITPKIFVGYKKRRQQEKQKIIDKFVEDSFYMDKDDEDGSFSDIEEFKQLERYLHFIQSMLLDYPLQRIEACLLKDYYNTFAEIAKRIHPSTVDVGYASGKLQVAEEYLQKELSTEKLQDDLQKTKQGQSGYDWIVYCLEKHAERLQQSEYESPIVAELILRAHIAITGGCSNYIRQQYINSVIEAIKPLWDLYRFYTRYIRPY